MYESLSPQTKFKVIFVGYLLLYIAEGFHEWNASQVLVSCVNWVQNFFYEASTIYPDPILDSTRVSHVLSPTVNINYLSI